MLLFAPPDVLREAVVRCCRRAGRRGHILNVGHGVVQARGPPPAATRLKESRRALPARKENGNSLALLPVLAIEERTLRMVEGAEAQLDPWRSKDH
jgi:hypothetical protein